MTGLSLRGTPLWARLLLIMGVLVTFLVGLAVFFGMSSVLFTWVNAATHGSLPGQNSVPWDVPVGRLLYASSWEGDYEIYLEKSGNAMRPARLTRDTGTDTYPAFSPDGDQVVFQSDRDGSDNLYIMDTDGGNVRALTSDENENWQPDWSPDGAQIVFSALGEDGDRHLFVIDIDGGNRTQLTTAGHDTQPKWSPDGSQIVFLRPSDTSMEVYIIDADGENETVLVSEPGTEADPSWSPDGSRVIFALTNRTAVAAIYTIEPDGSNLTRFQPTGGSGQFSCPVWSPDGQHVSIVWGITYQNFQIFEYSTGKQSGWAGSGSGGVQGCDWGW